MTDDRPAQEPGGQEAADVSAVQEFVPFAQPRRPTWRERTRPAELLGIAGVLAVFTALISLMASRDLVLSLIFGALAFILSVVVLAMLALAVAPNGEERAEIELPSDGPDGPAH
jgi:uncharacterized membrane protein